MFINRNAKDFLTKSVTEDLDQLGCKVLVKFEDARAYIENEIARHRNAT